MTSQVGIRLREERKRVGISQGAAALLAGISREMWNRYEGGAMPGSDVLLHLLGHGFDVNYILGGGRHLDEDTLLEDERALLTNYRDTDLEGRAAISRQARLEAIRAKTGSPSVEPPARGPRMKSTFKGAVGSVQEIAGDATVNVNTPPKKPKKPR